MPESHEFHNSPHKSDRYGNLKVALWLIGFVAIVAGGVLLWLRLYMWDTKPAATPKLTVVSIDLNSLTSEQKKAADTVQNFLEAIKSGKNAEAFDAFSEQLRKEYKGGLDEFSKAITSANLSGISQWAITSVETNGSKDRITVKGSALLSTPNPKAQFEFRFFKDSDGQFKLFSWQVYPEI